MSSENRSIYLERASYRQRRIQDASRLLPYLGLFLFFIPGLWQTASDNPGVNTTAALIFLFAAWIVVIVVTALIARKLKSPDLKDGDETGIND